MLIYFPTRDLVDDSETSLSTIYQEYTLLHQSYRKITTLQEAPVIAGNRFGLIGRFTLDGLAAKHLLLPRVALEAPKQGRKASNLMLLAIIRLDPRVEGYELLSSGKDDLAWTDTFFRFTSNLINSWLLSKEDGVPEFDVEIPKALKQEGIRVWGLLRQLHTALNAQLKCRIIQMTLVPFESGHTVSVIYQSADESDKQFDALNFTQDPEDTAEDRTAAEYRQGYLEAAVDMTIMDQFRIQLLRRNMSFEEFCNQHPDLNRNELTLIREGETRSVTVDTLLKLALALDVALDVKFVSQEQLVVDGENLTETHMQVPTYRESLRG